METEETWPASEPTDMKLFKTTIISNNDVDGDSKNRNNIRRLTAFSTRGFRDIFGIKQTNLREVGEEVKIDPRPEIQYKKVKESREAKRKERHRREVMLQEALSAFELKGKMPSFIEIPKAGVHQQRESLTNALQLQPLENTTSNKNSEDGSISSGTSGPTTPTSSVDSLSVFNFNALAPYTFNPFKNFKKKDGSYNLSRLDRKISSVKLPFISNGFNPLPFGGTEGWCDLPMFDAVRLGLVSSESLITLQVHQSNYAASLCIVVICSECDDDDVVIDNNIQAAVELSTTPNSMGVHPILLRLLTTGKPVTMSDDEWTSHISKVHSALIEHRNLLIDHEDCYHNSQIQGDDDDLRNIASDTETVNLIEWVDGKAVLPLREQYTFGGARQRLDRQKRVTDTAATTEQIISQDDLRKTALPDSMRRGSISQKSARVTDVCVTPRRSQSVSNTAPDQKKIHHKKSVTIAESPILMKQNYQKRSNSRSSSRSSSVAFLERSVSRSSGDIFMCTSLITKPQPVQRQAPIQSPSPKSKSGSEIWSWGESFEEQLTHSLQRTRRNRNTYKSKDQPASLPKASKKTEEQRLALTLLAEQRFGTFCRNMKVTTLKEASGKLFQAVSIDGSQQPVVKSFRLPAYRLCMNELEQIACPPNTPKIESFATIKGPQKTGMPRGVVFSSSLSGLVGKGAGRRAGEFSKLIQNTSLRTINDRNKQLREPQQPADLALGDVVNPAAGHGAGLAVYVNRKVGIKLRETHATTRKDLISSVQKSAIRKLEAGKWQSMRPAARITSS